MSNVINALQEITYNSFVFQKILHNQLKSKLP
jgi:hypothetical protein